MSDSLSRASGFSCRASDSVFNLPDGQVGLFLRKLNNRGTVKSILLVKKFWGLVEMTSGLVNATMRDKSVDTLP